MWFSALPVDFVRTVFESPSSLLLQAERCEVLCSYGMPATCSAEYSEVNVLRRQCNLGNHRMAWLERDLKDHPVTIPCHGQGLLLLDQLIQGLI